MMKPTGRLGAIAALVAASVLVAAPPSGAVVVERGTYSDSWSFLDEDCGFPLQVEGSGTGGFRMRAGNRRTPGAFLLRDDWTWRETITNLETDEWFVVRGRSMFNETKATRVEGTVFEFRTVEAGQPFVVEDSSGRVVLRDRGAIRRTVLFDTLGDDVPGGEFLGIVDLRPAGRHPSFADDFDFCALAAELTGA